MFAEHFTPDADGNEVQSSHTRPSSAQRGLITVGFANDVFAVNFLCATRKQTQRRHALPHMEKITYDVVFEYIQHIFRSDKCDAYTNSFSIHNNNNLFYCHHRTGYTKVTKET